MNDNTGSGFGNVSDYNNDSSGNQQLEEQRAHRAEAEHANEESFPTSDSPGVAGADPRAPAEKPNESIALSLAIGTLRGVERISTAGA